MRLLAAALLGLLLLIPRVGVATDQEHIEPDNATYEIAEIDPEDLPDDICTVGLRHFKAGDDTREELGILVWKATIDDCEQPLDDRTVVRRVLIEAIEEGERAVFRQTLWAFQPEPGGPALRVLAERFDSEQWKVFRDGIATASGQLEYAEVEVEPSVETDGGKFVEALARDLGHVGM